MKKFICKTWKYTDYTRSLTLLSQMRTSESWAEASVWLPSLFHRTQDAPAEHNHRKYIQTWKQIIETIASNPKAMILYDYKVMHINICINTYIITDEVVKTYQLL